jgi:hypothetical protein
MHACMHACIYVCMYVCMYFSIQSKWCQCTHMISPLFLLCVTVAEHNYSATRARYSAHILLMRLSGYILQLLRTCTCIQHEIWVAANICTHGSIIYIYIYIYLHTIVEAIYIHTYIHACIHAYKHTCGIIPGSRSRVYRRSFHLSDLEIDACPCVAVSAERPWCVYVVVRTRDEADTCVSACSRVGADILVNAWSRVVADILVNAWSRVGADTRVNTRIRESACI